MGCDPFHRQSQMLSKFCKENFQNSPGLPQSGKRFRRNLFFEGMYKGVIYPCFCLPSPSQTMPFPRLLSASSLAVVLTLPLLQNPIGAIAPPPPPQPARTIAATPVTRAQAQPLTFYQPLQTLQWEGTFVSKWGFAYFALEEGLNIPVSEMDLEIARKQGNARKEAELLTQLALVDLYSEQFFRAIDRYQAALEIAQREGSQLADLEGVALGGLGLAHVQKGGYTADAVEYLQNYYEFVRKQNRYFNGDRRQEGIALGNLGNAYFGADLYVQAIATHEKRLALAREIRDRSGEAKALGDLSLVFLALGNPEKAVSYQEKQLEISRQIKDQRGESLALANLGNTYHSLGDYTRAASYHQQRLTLAKQMQDLKAEAEALANLAGASYFLGDLDRAISLYEQAWKLAWNRLNDADVLYGMRGNQALAHLQKGDYVTALQYFQEYFTYVRSRENRRGQGLVKNNTGVLRLLEGNQPAAVKAFLESIEVGESLRSRLGSNDTYKVSIFDTQSAPYQNLQSLLVSQKQPESALEIAERGRARAFVDLLLRRQTPAKAGEPPVPTLKAPTIGEIRQIARTQNATLVTYSLISQTVREAKGVQNRETKLLIWVVKPEGSVVLRQVDLTTTGRSQFALSEVVLNSRDEIGARGRGGNRSSYQKASQPEVLPLRQLHQLLIEPIADQLPTHPDDPVIFVPQGSLFLVPFAALQDKQGKYLIEQHTISIAPSIQVLAFTRQRKERNRVKPSQGVLVVGNPTMPSVTVEAGEPPEQLSSLPGAEDEAKTIAQMLNTQPLIRDAATKTTVVQRMQQSRIVHLATHGLLDDFRGLGVPGAIALAPGAGSDGLLTAGEILDLNLTAELVVLSACDTGRGKITGDGVIGLSRSLISAGVPSVIVSLWAVPDAPTASLMVSFYENLGKEPNKARALRRAMLSTLQQYPDPLEWAAFTLIGEPQ